MDLTCWLIPKVLHVLKNMTCCWLIPKALFNKRVWPPRAAARARARRAGRFRTLHTSTLPRFRQHAPPLAAWDDAAGLYRLASSHGEPTAQGSTC